MKYQVSKWGGQIKSYGHFPLYAPKTTLKVDAQTFISHTDGWSNHSLGT